METKKVFYVISTLFLLLILIYSCQKTITETPEEQDKTMSITEKSFSPNFDWKMTRNITIEIKSSKKAIVNITSIDNQIKYHKGAHLGGAYAYTINLSIPTNVKQLSLNNQNFNISSSTITLDIIE